LAYAVANLASVEDDYMQITEEQLIQTVTEALFGYSQEQLANVQASDRFVHYTSAETAMNILKGAGDGRRYIWLRNASEMNDFSEIQWGKYCFNEAVIKTPEVDKRLGQLINQVDPDMRFKLALEMSTGFEQMQANTHLVSLARHDENLAKTGLLSMWRAYGGPENVCLVFNSAAFMGKQKSYELVLSPVLYANPSDYQAHFSAMLDRLEERIDILKHAKSDFLLFNLKRAIDFSILSTKHPAFREENEWRVIHYPNPFKDRDDPPCDIVCINGKVQKIYKIPMENRAEEGGLANSAPNELIDRIIVGPTQNYELVRAAFIKLMGDAGIESPEARVEFSAIPLRR
jgi:hypothetical protein